MVPGIRSTKCGFPTLLVRASKAARFLTFRSSSASGPSLHRRAFRRLGGATRVVVLDNLREGVLVPDIYDSTLNPLYRDVLAHYGAVTPCRIQSVRTLKRKGSIHRPSNDYRGSLKPEGLPKTSRSLNDYTGTMLASFAAPAPSHHHALQRKQPSCRFPWKLFVTTSTASGA